MDQADALRRLLSQKKRRRVVFINAGSLKEYFNRFEHICNIIYTDTGEGISESAINLIKASDSTIIAATPEPNSITSAYALIKMSKQELTKPNFNIIIYRAKDKNEGDDIFLRLQTAAGRFLRVDLDYLGCLTCETHSAFEKSIAEIGDKLLCITSALKYN